jgi:hypothetical protein
VVRGRLGVDVGVDQGDLRVHAPGAGVVDHHRAALGRDRSPLPGHGASGGEERQVGAVEHLGGEGSDLDLLAADGQPAPGRAGRGDQPDLAGGQRPLAHQRPEVLPDRPGGPDDHDRRRHQLTTGSSAVPSG